MQSRMSRGSVFAGLSANSWVVLFQKEDPTQDEFFNYRGLNLHLVADSGNRGNVEVIVQDSVDGTTWTNRFVAPAAIVPGGMYDLSVVATGRYVRVLVFSTGVGRVDGTILTPEEHALPGIWPDVSSLACASYCEVSAES